jgi:glucosamine kinase
VRWWVGIDGGGTGTRAVVADAEGRILGRGESGASALGQGAEQAWRHVGEAISRAAVPGLTLEDCALGLGLSGTGVPVQLQAFIAADPGVARFTLVTDGLAALLGAHGGGPGALLISGTGSVAEALLPDGSRRMVGGWGWQIGDEGSGAWLGQQAMKIAQAAFDDRAPRGALAESVYAVTGPSREALLAFCAQAGQGGYASLARLVFDCEASDPAAAALLDAAARALDELAAALHPTLPLALAGSIALRLGNRLSPALQSRRAEPQGDAAAGALWLIQQQTKSA